MLPIDHRNQEIPKIVEQMKDLSSLYQEMNNIVIEQGTLMDRIDSNIYEALDYA